MNEVALLILFNHNFERNIERLEAIYQHRFSNIYFIMPFYQGSRKDVIPVYENSLYFQGYIAQALKQIRHVEFEHYLVIGDDLILNPQITELNFKQHFQVDQDTAFIPGMFLLNDVSETGPHRPYAPFWEHVKSALNFTAFQKGIEASRYLPSYEEALESMNDHGIEFSPEMPKRFFVPRPLIKKNKSLLDNLRRLKVVIDNLKYICTSSKIPYPMVGSYSDITIIPNAHKEKFILYSGVFSSLDLFVEIALPTALVYSMPNIVTEKQLMKKGHTYWGIEDFNYLEAKYKRSLSVLFNNFPEDTLYIHPIKLSRWE
jgi:hypothetical protein